MLSLLVFPGISPSVHSIDEVSVGLDGVRRRAVTGPQLVRTRSEELALAGVCDTIRAANTRGSVIALLLRLCALNDSEGNSRMKEKNEGRR